MKKLAGYLVLCACALVALAQQPTPNIGLQIPATGSNNWYIPLNYNFSKLDQLLSGNIAIPALRVTNDVVIGGTVTANAFSTGGGTNFASAVPALQYSAVYYSSPGSSSTFSGINPFTGLLWYRSGAPPLPATVLNLSGLWTGCSSSVPALRYDGTCYAPSGGGGGTGVVGSGTGGQIAQYPSSGTSVQGVTLSQDCSLAVGGVITCTKTNNVSFAPSATVDATNAANIGSGTLPVARGGTGASTLPSGLLASNGGTSPVRQGNINDINSALGYTPALGPNFTSDFSACYIFTEPSTSLIDHCGSNNGTVSGTAPIATGKSWQFTMFSTTPVVLPAALNTTKTWYFALSIPPAQAGGFNASQVNTILGNTAGGFTQLDINATNAISVFQTFGSFNSFSPAGTSVQIDNVFNGPAILTLVCTLGQSDVIYFNGVQAINTQANPGVSACGKMTSGSFELGGTADSGNFTAFAEFYDVRFSNNAHTPIQVAQNVSALINELSGRGISLFPSIKYVYPIQQLFFAGDSITCGFASAGTPSCVAQATPYVPGTNSSSAYEYNLSLEQAFGINAFGTPSAMIEQQSAAASVLYAPLCYTQKGQSIASLFEGTNNFSVGESAALTWSYAAGWSKLMHSFGCKTIFIAMISRGQPSGVEAFKVAYDAIARANWKQAGFDAFVDMEADPFMGCLNCNTNGTYFSTTDLTHPTPAGHLKIAAAVSATVNYVSNGSSPGNPNPVIVTAATYTSTFDDGGLIFDTTANNIIDTLTTAQWQSGREISRCNNTVSGSHTLTITAPSDFPFNNVSGSTTVTIANNTCQRFQSTYIAGTPNGDYWRLVN